MEDASWFLFIIAFWALIYAWVVDKRRRSDAETAQEKFELLQRDFAILEQRVKSALAAPSTGAAAPSPDVRILTEATPKLAASHTAPVHAPLVTPKPAPATPEKPAVPVAATPAVHALCKSCARELTPGAE